MQAIDICVGVEDCLGDIINHPDSDYVSERVNAYAETMALQFKDVEDSLAATRIRESELRRAIGKSLNEMNDQSGARITLTEALG